jgi:predicted deacetylase
MNTIWFGTDDEAEFARLDASEAERRLTSGIEIFSQAFGGAPQWFCAPRWQTSAAARQALRRVPLGLLDRDAIVTSDGRRIASPVVWFDDGVRLAARLMGSVQRWQRVARALAGSAVVRVALHPRDLSPATRPRIAALFERLGRAGWEPSSLDEAIARS